jgi:putative tryptophan/tyrosine transport system ATP-binding protein
MTAAMQVRDLAVAFNRGTPDEIWPLHDLSLTLREGEYATVVGPNGAGKSTLLNTIAGAAPAARGAVSIAGTDVTRQPEHRRASRVARVMQDPRQNTCPDLSVEENLAIAVRRGMRRSWLRPALRGRELEAALELLAAYAPALDARRRDLVGRLSGGQRQVLAMVMAVAAQPAVLLLDEHTSALDPQVAARVLELTDELIGRAGTTTLMVTHNMRQALAHGSRLLILCQGRLVDDVDEHEKRQMDELALVERFRRAVAGELTDRLVAG